MNTGFTILKELYNSEINYKISTFWDVGCEIKLGDEKNGYQWEGVFEDVEVGILELLRQAKKYYPESSFAEWVKKNRYYSIGGLIEIMES